MLKTRTTRNRERRDKKVLAELNRLIAQPGAMQTACIDAVGQKFGLSRATIYNIYKRSSTL